MAEGTTATIAAASAVKPPLDMGVRLRLSVMMFLQFAVWGAWFTSFGNYIVAPNAPLGHGLGFEASAIGQLMGLMALGAIFAMMITGQIADRFVSSEYLMAGCHLAGAILLYAMAHVHSYNALWWTTLAYALLYNPTLALANSIAFAHVPDASRDFPTLRVLGTIGWIVAGLVVMFLLPKNAENTNMPLLLAAGISAALGVVSFALPHTPPTGKQGDSIPFLRACKLIRDPGFGVFFGLSFFITIALAFYYNYTSAFLKHLKPDWSAPGQMTIGQIFEIVFMLLLPFALKRLGIKWVLGVGMAAWALRYGLFSLAHPYILVLLGVALHGVCFDFFLAAGFIYTDGKAPPSIRTSAQSLYSFIVYGLGMWLGGVASGKIAGVCEAGGRFNWSKFWLCPAGGAAVCLVIFLLVWRDRPGKSEDAPAPA